MIRKPSLWPRVDMRMKMGRRKRTRRTVGIREKQRRFVRRSVWTLSALSLLAIVPVVASDHGRQMASAVAAAIADPAALLDQRSPGARAAGALTQTKQRRLASHTGRAREPFVPVERVLAGERRRPGDTANIPGFVPDGGVETPLPGDAPPPIDDAFSPTAGGTGGTGGGGGATVPSVPIISGGGGGGGPTPTPTPTPTPVPTPEPTPVPEPATWLLTLTGFAALATALRRRRRVERGRPGRA